MLLVVLLVMVGEEVNEMQLAGWIGDDPDRAAAPPGWVGTWFSVFPNVQTFVAQAWRWRSCSAPTGRPRSRCAAGPSWPLRPAERFRTSAVIMRP